MRRNQHKKRRQNASRRFRALLGEALEPRLVLSLAPQLLADLNTAPAGFIVHGPIIEMNGVAYFSGSAGTSDYELWRSDGTTAGTMLVKDINPGSSSSNLHYLTNINGTLWFSATDGFAVHGQELWKSDGTAAGTVMVKDIDAGSFDSSPAYFTNVNGTVFFTAFDFDAGTELWRTDGTAAGTVRVKDISPGLSPSNIGELTNFNGKLFFRAADTNADWQLWSSDGTDAGTVKVTSVTGAIFGLYPDYLTNVSGTLYFSGSNGTDGTELWKSDGTAAGTKEVADIIAGSFSSEPEQLTNLNGTLLFTPFFGDGELWRSDGTAAGTVQVKDIYTGLPSSAPQSLVNIGGMLFFTAQSSAGNREPYVSDGTAAGTQLLKDVQPGFLGSSLSPFVQVGSSVYFGNSPGNIVQLWKTDGTAAGTVMVDGQIPASNAFINQGVKYLTNVGGKLFFSVNDGVNGYELWVSDGSAAGTAKVPRDATTNDSSGIANVTVIGNTAFFTALDPAHGRELWKTDGTAAGTALLSDIFPGPTSSSIGFLVNLNGTLLFSANDGVNGNELWKSDGTAAGTSMLRDINPGAYNSFPKYLTNVNGTVYFSDSGVPTLTELWKTDGTTAGTALVKDINSGGSSSPTLLTNVNGRLFFVANDGTSGNELWTSDGTATGTIRLKDIASGSASSTLSFMTAVGSTLFFVANDGINGNQLWKSNGTAVGTVLLKTIASSGVTPAPASLTNVNGTLYFAANDGTSGTELWKSDGTSTGTVRLKDIRSGSSGSNTSLLTNVNGALFFVANDGTTGSELWKSDGTAAGTILVKDIVAGSSSSQISDVTNIRGVLVFDAVTSASGREMWKSDGTAAGTTQILDVVPGAGSSSPKNMVVLGRSLVFTADDGTHGRELWGAVPDINVAPSGTDKTATVLEDTPYPVAVADFGFTDSGNVIPDNLLFVQITSLPASGTLQLNGIDFPVNGVVPVADITGGKLVYTPPPNKNGSALVTIAFKVQDDGGTANGGSDLDPTSNTLTINVTGVNDPPASADFSTTAYDHRRNTISFAQFPFSDPSDTPPAGTGPANSLAGVKITTLPAVGTLTYNGGLPVSVGQIVRVAETLEYTPAATDFGSQSAYTSFTFQVQDNGTTANGGIDLDPTPNTLTVDLFGNNTAPVGGNSTVATLEDTDYKFLKTDFPFSDPGDSPPDNLAYVQIVTVPAKGTLYQGTLALTAGAVVPVSLIDAAALHYTPGANGNGAAYDTFTFKVQDDGLTANGGQDTDLVARTMTINVSPVNDPPAGASKTINPSHDNTLLEDHNWTFFTSDFGFSDPNDALPMNPAGPNAFVGILITTLPIAGTLRDGTSALQAGQFVPVTDISSLKLVFIPAANANGFPYASFTFQVRDDGLTINGGQDTDPIPKTMTLNVTPVNDAPVAADKTIPISEDTSYTFSVNDFSFDDPNDAPPNSGPANNWLNVIVTPPAASAGTLQLGTTTVAPGTPAVIPVSSISQLVFTPAANINSGNAPSPTIAFKVQDDGGVIYGGQDVSVTPNTFTFNISSVNDPPSGANGTINPTLGGTLLEDGSYTFSASDFPFIDPFDNPANAFLGVKIATIPFNGTLSFNGGPITPAMVQAGYFVLATDLDLHKLAYAPAANTNNFNTVAPTFTFQVQDMGGTANGGIDLDPTPHTITLNVTPVNDAPQAVDNSVTAVEDKIYTFSRSDFPFSDPQDTIPPIPPNNFAGLFITALPSPTTGSLKRGSSSVALFSFVSVSDLDNGLLTFAPAADANGNAFSSFTFRVKDDGGTAFGGVDTDQNDRKLTVSVTPVSDAPIGTNSTVTLLEDSVHTFVASDFGFADPHDNPQDTFSAVKITTLPTSGSLFSGGAAVKAADFVPAANISSLTFSPAANGNGAAYASFTFQVQDNGLTANGGLDLDLTPKTMTLSVTPVNDAPTGHDATISGNEDQSHTFSVADFGFSDATDGLPPSAGPANGLQSVLIVAAPTHGTLTVNGNAVSDGTIVFASQINAGSLLFVPVADDNGVNPPYDAFTFHVRDDGGTLNSGQDSDPVAHTLSLAIAAANDPPHFVKGSDQSVTDESGAQSVAWATSMSAGPPDESAQQLHFEVQGNTNPTLFASGPTVDSSGKLTFTPAFNVAGSAQITIVAVDDGGTANGGQDTSSPQTFTINVAKAHVWHNASNALDVNGDGHIFPNDALKIINFINAFGSQPVPNDGSASGPYIDVIPNGFVAPNDALAVINVINAGGSGEGEAAPDSSDDLLLTLIAYDVATAQKQRRI
jgi:ELWxxDGT repeat protein